ncbi:MAG: DUF21 domain-containing protein [Thermogutta sp.]|nr:DUF21 domain-containing protein [Thermogutta sp.]
MIALALILTAAGLLLSGFFSGSETALYRVARLRLELAAKTGDRVMAAVAWIAARPWLFIGTLLVGNNVANYVFSMGVILIIQNATDWRGAAAETAAALLAAPLLFLCGELLPKRLGLEAPFAMLQRFGPLLIFFAVLFAPVSLLLYLWNRLWKALAAAGPEDVRSFIADRELRHILDEAREAGLLFDVQRVLAARIFAAASQPITAHMRPLSQFPMVPWNAPAQEVEAALRPDPPFVLLRHPKRKNIPAGYLFAVSILLRQGESDRIERRPLIRVPADETVIEVLTQLYESGEPIAVVRDRAGSPLGVVLESDLRRALLAAEDEQPPGEPAPPVSAT